MGRVRHVLAAVIVLVGVASTAAALTTRDIVELSKAGLGDEVLLALIDVDRSVFSIDAETLKMLKAAGVSEAVIVAMIRSGRTREADVPPPPPPQTTQLADQEPAPAPAPQVIVIDHHDSVEVPVAVPVAVPVFVLVPRRPLRVDPSIPARPGNVPRPGNDLSPRQSDLSPQPERRDRPSQPCTTPVYWGFGGKLRPDSWQPPSSCR